MTIAGPQPVTNELRRVVMAAVVAVVLAALQLFVFTTHTDDWFAWTVANPLTAAMLGAGYLAALPMLLVQLRATRWADARAGTYGTTAFTLVTLLTTLLHLDTFHFDEGPATAKIAAWGWLAVYALLPLALAWVIARQRRAPGLEPMVDGPTLTPVGQRTMHLVGLAAIAVAVVLFVGGDRLDWWPWRLTDLTARALAGWGVALGATAVAAAREREVVRIRHVLVAGVAYAVLVLVALARYHDRVDWSPAGTIFAIAIAAVGALCGAALLRPRAASGLAALH